jgi:hypothetical protein
MEHGETTAKRYVIERKTAFPRIASNLIDLTFVFSSAEVGGGLDSRKMRGTSSNT